MSTNASRGSGAAACLSCGRSRSAASAGLSVSELNAEMTVETAIVSANCRKNWPVMPLMNAHGTNTATEHQADGDDRAGHLSIALMRRVARRQAVLDVVLDGLDDDDGVVDDDADGQHQAEQRQVVQAEADDGHDGEGADDGHRHGDQRDDRRPPVLQEQQHDDGHEDDRLAQRLERPR